MGKSTPSPPPVPNPVTVANAQSAADINTAEAQGAMNRVNQITPTGNLSYSQSGTQTLPNGTVIPTYTATTTLTPAETQALQSQQALTQGLYGLSNTELAKIANNTGSPFQLSDYGAAPTADAATLKQAQDAVYNQQASRLDPQWAQTEEQTDAQLKNQGFTPGTKGYDDAFANMERAKTDAYQTAQNNAVTAGQTQEANQYNLSSNAYQTALQNALLQRELPINETSALVSGQQITPASLVSTPNTTVQPTNVIGAYGLAQNQANANYQAKLAQNSANAQGIFGLGGAALSALPFV